MEPTRGHGLPARIPQATRAPPTPEKVLCKRNLYANVVLLLLRHPCPQGWGPLKVLSKEHFRALTRAGCPPPRPRRGPLHWPSLPLELMFSESHWNPQNPTSSFPDRAGRGGQRPAGPSWPTRRSLLAFVFPGLPHGSSSTPGSFELWIRKENSWRERHLEPRRGGEGIQEFPEAWASLQLQSQGGGGGRLSWVLWEAGAQGASRVDALFLCLD